MKKINLLSILLILVIMFGCSKESIDTNQESGNPDLIVTLLNVTNYSDTAIYYSFTLKNIGTASANLDGPTTVEYDNVSIQTFLSTDTIYSNDDKAAGGTILGLSPLGFLQPNQTFSGTNGCYFNDTIDFNTYLYLILIVDWGHSVAESNENNNVIYCKIK
jgi:hypothetical protein